MKVNVITNPPFKLYKKMILLVSIIFLCSNAVLAQQRWAIQVRPGVDFSTNKLGDAKLTTGYGFDATVNYKFIPQLALYAGWGWNKFSADKSFAGDNNDFEETGYTFGLQFMHPFERTKLHYLIDAGIINNHIEVENSDGDIIADSGHGLGWQAGIGIAVPLNEHINFLTGVRYHYSYQEILILIM